MKHWTVALILGAALLSGCSSSDSAKDANGSGSAASGTGSGSGAGGAGGAGGQAMRRPARRRIWCSPRATGSFSTPIATT